MIYFYNNNTGSKTENTTVAFRYEKPLLNKIIDIITQQPIGSFDIKGKTKQIESKRSVLCSPNINHFTQQHFPNAMLADETGSIKMTVWSKLASIKRGCSDNLRKY